jgi:hypothetical protein
MKRIWWSLVSLVLIALAMTGCAYTKQITVPANSDTTCTVHTIPGAAR